MHVLIYISAISRPLRWALVIACAIVTAVLLLHLGPIPQRASYHDFADQRTILGIAHFWNVVSNLPILLAGLAGLVAVVARGWRAEFSQSRLEGPLWALFFTAVSLTAFGSAYYHLAPDSPRLFWDRLPLALAAACLPTALLVERVPLGRRGLLALGAWLALGPLSVVVWHGGEALGGGDLRLYGLVQFGALAAAAAIILFSRPTYSGNLYCWAALGCYLLAKFTEKGDAAIYSLGELISGHTLKHALAALAVALLGHRVNWRNRL